MASAFGHAVASLAIGQVGITAKTSWRLMAAGVLLSILPDADSIGFFMGVPYHSFWGHRGFSHSIVFALLISIIVQQFFFARHKAPAEQIRIVFF